MAEKEDFYKILGVDKNASTDEVRKAYRTQALKYHPDKNPGNKEAEEKMKEINEAYEVLSDPEKKQLYDQFGHQGINPSAGGSPGFGGFDGFDLGDIFRGQQSGEGQENIFEDLLGGIFNTGRGSSRRKRGQRRGNDLLTGISISLEEAYSGIEKEIGLKRKTVCPTCSGNGARPGSGKKTCPSCKGRGEIRQATGFFSMVRTCSHCGGEGTVIESPCPECGGRGVVNREKKIKIKIPAGIDIGQRLRLHGEGEAVPGGIPGDLYAEVSIQPHRIFIRDEADLIIKKQVSFPIVSLGGEIEIETIDRHKINVKIPSGTQSGTVLRLKDKGMPILSRPGRYGDLKIEVEVMIPKKITPRQADLLKEFQKIEDEKNSSGFFDKLFK